MLRIFRLIHLHSVTGATCLGLFSRLGLNFFWRGGGDFMAPLDYVAFSGRMMDELGRILEQSAKT
jgi:hypothetical protein